MSNVQYTPDVVIVGAGFGGISALYYLRKAGLKCLILESGTDIGGVWHWTHYPGARVDSSMPSYAFGMRECWEDWDWSCNYPDSNELRQYLDHCDKKLKIREHVMYSMKVVGANYDQVSHHWTTTCGNGQTFTSKYLVIAIGCTSEPAPTTLKDGNKFKGEIYDASSWPSESINPEGKHVAVIGTGSTGVQIVQAWGIEAKSLTLFQRTPNIAIPVRLMCFTEEEKRQIKDRYPAMLEYRRTVPTGLDFPLPIPRSIFDDPPEERESTLSKLYDRGGFPFWISTYQDVMRDPDANREVYDFWVKRTRSRITDPRKREILAPLEAPHPFGVKRPAMENQYFELFNNERVDVVDVSEDPISYFTETGIITKDGSHYQADVIVLAMGFASPIDSLQGLGLRGVHGAELKDIWAERVLAYLGIMCHGFPNMFIIDGPSAPSEMSNVPLSIEVQADWIAGTVKKMEADRIKALHPTRDAAEQWADETEKAFCGTLYGTMKSRFTTVCENRLQPVYFSGGIPRYIERLAKAHEKWDDFIIT